MQLFGARRCGCAIIEGALALAGLGYDFVFVDGFDKPGPARDRLGAVNPLHQVPALVLDDGTILTETGAIFLHLSDLAPGLAPAPGTPDRIRFHRLLIWIVANLYPTFTYDDHPRRWAPSAPTELDAPTAGTALPVARRPGDRTVRAGRRPVRPRHIYLAVLVAWRPGRDWFHRNTPRIARIAERTRRLPPIAEVMKLNGW